jgi:hypothetical protein
MEKNIKWADEALYIVKNSGRIGYMGPLMEKGEGKDCRSL